MADREAVIPIKTDVMFRIASMSKAVTSLAVMMLLIFQAEDHGCKPVNEGVP